MLIAIQDYIVYATGGIAVLILFVSIMLFMAIKKSAPDAFTHWKASRTGDKICRVHFRGKQTCDFIATVEKSEKDMGTPYWKVPSIGLKFKPEADSIHFIENGIACCDYYEKMPKSIKIEIAVAYSQLRDYFKKIGIPIDGIEDIAFYILSESEVTGAENAILDARINSEKTKTILRQFINKVNQYKEKLKDLQLQSGVFTWQTASNALDSTVAYTSASLTHTVETVRAAERRREEDKRKELQQQLVTMATIAIIGIIVLYGIKGL